MSIMLSTFSTRYHGKPLIFPKTIHATGQTLAHFLNNGKWNDTLLADYLKASVINTIYSED